MSRSSNAARSDHSRAGRAYAPNAPFSGSLPGMLMSHMMVVRWGPGSLQGWGAPAAAAANNICTSQAIASATTAVLNGSLVSGGVAVLDVPRNLQLVSSGAGDTTQTATIRGIDTVGRAVTETVAMNGTNSVTSLRAFKQVNSITFSAALAGNLTVGTGVKLGLPVKIRAGDVISKVVNDAAPEAGTIVAADTNTPSATTGDPCGTYTSGTAPNGSNVYTLLINVEDRTENAYGSNYSS